MCPYFSMVIALLLMPYTLAGEPTHRDIEYARIGDDSLKLDLYLPKQAKPPLIVYVHGGAWRSGSKSDVPVQYITLAGGKHGGAEFYDTERTTIMATFLVGAVVVMSIGATLSNQADNQKDLRV